MQVDKIVLERFQYGMQMMFSEDVFTNEVKVDVHESPIWQSMCKNVIVTFRKDIFGLDKKIDTITYPATWVDAVKEHFYPKLPKKLRSHLANKHPIHYTNYEVIARELYPHLTVPDQDGYITIRIVRGDSNEQIFDFGAND